MVYAKSSTSPTSRSTFATRIPAHHATRPNGLMSLPATRKTAEMLRSCARMLSHLMDNKPSSDNLLRTWKLIVSENMLSTPFRNEPSRNSTDIHGSHTPFHLWHVQYWPYISRQQRCKLLWWWRRYHSWYLPDKLCMDWPLLR